MTAVDRGVADVSQIRLERIEHHLRVTADLARAAVAGHHPVEDVATLLPGGFDVVKPGRKEPN